MDSIKGKKIVFIITKSNWGGAQAYVYALAKHYSSKGADVAVALGGTGEPDAPTGLLAKKLEESQIRTILLPAFARNISLRREFSAFSEVRKMLKKERPDIVHLNSSKAGGLGALAARREHIRKIVFTAHGWAFREPRPFVSRSIIWISSWYTVFLCHKVIVVSQLDYKTSPVLFSRKKIVLVKNGIPSFELLPKDLARERLVELTDNRFLGAYSIWLVIQSELHKNKGVDIAIKAFAMIAREHDDCALVVLGEGEDRRKLEKMIVELQLEKRVALLGFIPNSRAYLTAGSVFLLPSRKEGLPLTLLEAGTAGLPVIATRTGGVPEIVTARENGLLIDPGSTGGLRDAILENLSNMAAAAEMGRRLKRKVAVDFSEEKMFTETEQVYLS